ncbi:MAG: hypothetical protein EAZ89_17530 [Bacteroidetes bacterium]|nr:MAG: hypothetical protein EAZ89_17530 [Bacteroidota bacterium]
MTSTLHPTLRHTFLLNLAQMAAPLSYGALKIFGSLPDEHSDLDLIVKKDELTRWEQLCRGYKGVEKAVFRRKSYATYVELYFSDNSYLELDLIHSIQRKGQVFLSANDLISASTAGPEGLKVVPPYLSFVYICLFFNLNYSPVPDKYRQIFAVLPTHQQSRFLQWMGSRFGLLEPEVFFSGKKTALFESKLPFEPENQGLRGLFRRISSAWDAIWQDKRPVITFSGVDGAGKSTILSQTLAILTEKYRRRVVVIRHRPSLLPILSSYTHGKAEAERRAASSLPRQGKNQNPLSSVLRFAYYYADYVFGQWYILLKYSLRGQYVLYDRYYFDFIADGRRSNIELPVWLTSFLYIFLLKPRLNFLLYATPEEILKRKQELSAEDIRSLTDRYLGLFQKLEQRGGKARYIAIHNQHIEATLDTIESEFRNIC